MSMGLKSRRYKWTNMGRAQIDHGVICQTVRTELQSVAITPRIERPRALATLEMAVQPFDHRP